MIFPSTVPLLEPETQPRGPHDWTTNLDVMQTLQAGWNGYDAEPPSELALETARRFITVLESESLPPTRVAPSVVGGVGITRKVGERRVYVEFYNDGSVHSLFAEGEEAETVAVAPTPEGFRAIASRMRVYLDA